MMLAQMPAGQPRGDFASTTDSWKELVRDVVINGSTGYSDHEIVEFKILRRAKEGSKYGPRASRERTSAY